MNFIWDFENVCFNESTAVALGNFDGVHLGHMQLIKRTVEISKEHFLKSIVMAFKESPLNILEKKIVEQAILSNEDKGKIVCESGIDNIVFMPFTSQIAGLSPEEFVSEILVGKLNAKFVVCGFNYNFGKNGSGNAKMLKDLCEKASIKTEIIEPFTIDNVVVSSSYIRRLVSEGEIAKANRFLGYNYFVRCSVGSGIKLGTKIGIPTINQLIDTGMVKPKRGVYITKTHINDKTYGSVTNVGVKPTVTDTQTVNIETNILDFSGNLYNKEVKVEFIDRIRDEIKFDNIEDLKKQITKDIEFARDYFSKNGI